MSGIKKNQEETTKSIVRSLVPKILVKEKELERVKPYLDSLKDGIEAKGVTNIAITGDYGSGKSTLLKTFQSQNTNYNYINVSLASFKDEIIEQDSHIKENKGVINKVNDLDRLLELSILQQIFYHVAPDEIPDSRFKRIKGVSQKQILVFAVGFIIWLMSLIVLFKFKGIDKSNPDNWTFKYTDLNVPAFLSVIIFLLGIGYLMFKLARMFNNSRISKLSMSGEIELGKDLHTSIMNEHLDEILYFFENTNYNVIVIEDLDRFRNTRVFTKLREINLLLNNSKLIKRDVVFIYAIRDDMFQNKERVKFFDYIIPVIPFVNSSNATDQLHRFIKEEGLEHDFKEEFIDDVITFIDDIDMRLLTNIFQEFGIYRKNIGKGLIIDNLLAIIIYKNLYPQDFVNLHKRKGSLYRFINQKNLYIKELLKNNNKEIQNINGFLKDSKNEKIDSIDNLKSIYLAELFKSISNISSILLNGDIYKIDELSEDEVFDILLDEKDIKYETFVLNSYYSRYDKLVKNSGFPFSKIEDKVDKNRNFRTRKKNIINKSEDESEELKNKLQELRGYQETVKSWDLKNIFNVLDISTYLMDFKDDKLIRNLLLNGYIDENYNQYISLFHESTIKHNDYVFEKNLKSGMALPNDYELDKLKNLVKRIPLKYFSSKAILNYDLLSFLLANEDKYTNKLDAFIEQLVGVKSGSQSSYEAFKFIDEYITKFEVDEEKIEYENSGSVYMLVKMLSAISGILWNELLSGLATKNKINKYLRIINRYSDVDALVNNPDINRFKNYISSNIEVISLFSELDDAQKFATLLQKLDINFNNLVVINEQNKKIYDFIYENNHYDISKENIECIISSYDDSIDLEELKKSNYTTIKESKCKHLIDYVDRNIDLYVNQVLIKIKENVKESESTVIYLLNHSNVSEEDKIKIIKQQTVKVTDLSSIESYGTQIEILSSGKIETSWKNVIHYYKSSDNEIDLILVDYLNKESIHDELAKVTILLTDSETEEMLSEISSSLIKLNGLNQKAYEGLLKSIPTAYNRWSYLSFEELDEKKVSWLIENNFLSLSKKNFDSLNDNFPSLKIRLIEKRQYGLISELEGDLHLTDEEIDLTLKSKKIIDAIKVELIKKEVMHRVVTDSNLAKIVAKIVYETKAGFLEYKELFSVIRSSNLLQERVVILNNHMSRLDDMELKVLVKELKEEYPRMFITNKRPRFNNTPENMILIKELERRGLIKKFILDEKGEFIKVLAHLD